MNDETHIANVTNIAREIYKLKARLRGLDALLAFANSVEIKEAQDGEFWLMLNCGRRSTAVHLGRSHAIFDDIEQLRRSAIKKATPHD